MVGLGLHLAHPTTPITNFRQLQLPFHPHSVVDHRAFQMFVLEVVVVTHLFLQRLPQVGDCRRFVELLQTCTESKDDTGLHVYAIRQLNLTCIPRIIDNAVSIDVTASRIGAVDDESFDLQYLSLFRCHVQRRRPLLGVKIVRIRAEGE